MILAIDFDEVIHAKSMPVPGRRMGEPLPGTKAALEHFKRKGDTIIVFTVMATDIKGRIAVQQWLDYYDVPYDEVTAIKPNADLFIDDKAIRHINWDDTLRQINEIHQTKTS